MGRIIPAYAGSTSSYPTCELPRTDHPRIRGEHPSGASGSPSVAGSSPHTRGALRQQYLPRPGCGIIPAYAGSTSITARGFEVYGDHPRIRGEHHRGASMCTSASGSSPHTRGAPAPGFSIRPGAGIIPAYAGSTCTCWRAPRRGSDHPRIRGEHQMTAHSSGAAAGSSPHTRGARRRRHPPGEPQWIIPAYAGSTRERDGGLMAAEDHPRIRGEHRGVCPTSPLRAGSSPHTRGARTRRSP